MTGIAVVAAPFGRDLERCLASVAGYVEQARALGADLLVLPEMALGGYLAELQANPDRPHAIGPPPALDPDGPEIGRLIAMAGDLIICIGYAERGNGRMYNSAVCLNGDGVLGRHRKVHLPLGEKAHYATGHGFAAFDTPIGRMGMMICYDKAFPEAARTLALDGAEIIACISAWPTARTAPAALIAEDRWTYRFNQFDSVRAMENQVVWASANQTGEFGTLRFLGNAKIVDPGGETLANTGTATGMAFAEVDLAGELTTARRSMFHLRDRRPETYGAPCLLAGRPGGIRAS
jgi:N-carbamoylputrescine amidase